YELLAGRGVEIVLVARDRPEQVVTPRVVIYRTLGPKSFGFSFHLLKVLDRECPDLIHLHGLWTYASVAVQMWRRRTGKPVVVSPHGMVDGWAIRHHALKKWIAGAGYEWSNLRNASCIHALTEGEAEALNQFGVRDRTVTIPNGIDLAER